MSARLVPSSSTVYTPGTLANAMVRAVGDVDGGVWVDPCVGDGAFVTALADLGVPKARVRALDLSRRRSDRDDLARTLRGIDFVAWASRRTSVCDRVVMNPPYVALSRLKGKPRAAALRVRVDEDGLLKLKGNYWCAFVLSAIRALRAGGSLAAVLPAAWDYARYAVRVRAAVTLAFGEITVVRSSTPLFHGVLDGAVVVIAKLRGKQPGTFRRVEVRGATEAARVLESIGESKPLSNGTTIRSIAPPRRRQISLNEVMDVRIGGVTGDAHYFLFTEQERKDFRIPLAAMRPVVTRARHLKAPFVTTAKWRQLLEAGERIWLFSPPPSVTKHVSVAKYLRAGREGACHVEGYKIQARQPWYRTRLPERVDGFLSGMSKKLPFLVVNEMPSLSATNTLYVVRFRSTIDLATKFAIGTSLLSSHMRRQLALRARVYADGLLKFEPAELGALRLTLPEHAVGARAAFVAATAKLLSGDDEAASGIADRWLAGSGAGGGRVVASADRVGPGVKVRAG